MTDLVQLRPADSLHLRCALNTPEPVDWGDERTNRFRPVYPLPNAGVLVDNGYEDAEESEEALAKARALFRGTSAEAEWKESFLPQWNRYFPVEFSGVDPRDAANLIYDLAPDVTLVRFDRRDPTYGLAAHAVGLSNLWPFLFAHVCCGAVPPLYLVQSIELRGIPQERARRVEAVYNSISPLRRYLAESIERVAQSQNIINTVLDRRANGQAEIGG